VANVGSGTHPEAHRTTASLPHVFALLLAFTRPT